MKQAQPSKATAPVGSLCEEASVHSKERIPCGARAVYVVQHDGEKALFMCAPCASHNVNNRCAQYLTGGSLAKALAEHGKNSRGPAEEIEVEAAPEASGDQLKKVVALGTTQLALRREITALEGVLASKQLALKTNMEADLPQAMSEAGIEKFTLEGGIDVKIKKVVRASIPKSDAEPGLDYMDKAAPDLVKRTLKLEFDRTEETFFRKFMRDMKKRKKQPKMTYDRSVNPQTLGKFVRERDEAGKGVPEKALGVYRVTTAVVELPEAKADKDALE